MQFAPISTYTRTFERNVLIKSFSEEERAQYWEQAQNSFMNPLLAAVCAILEKKEFREFKDIQINDVPPTQHDRDLWSAICDTASVMIKYSVTSGGPIKKTDSGEFIPSKRVEIAVSVACAKVKQTLIFTIDNSETIAEDDRLAEIVEGEVKWPITQGTEVPFGKVKMKFHTMVDQPTTNFALMSPAVLTIDYDRVSA